MKKMTLFLLSAFCFSYLFAQEYDVKGFVKDENNKSLSYVTVALSDLDSILIKGAVTDSTGHYALHGVKNGNYLFTVKCMGFDTYSTLVEMKDKNVEMPGILLKTSNYLLNEVEVRGRTFIRKEDHILILPDRQEVKHAVSGYDLLYNLMVPGLEVDRQSGVVKNFNGAVSMYIDGRKADYREVRTLRSRDIEKIEYHDAPTGIYSNETGVINYITKQYKSGGYISLDGGQSIGYLNGDYQAAAKLTRGNTTYKFFGGHTMSKSNSTTEMSEMMKMDSYDLIRDRDGYEAVIKTNGQYARFDVMNSTQKRTLSGKFTFARSSTPLNYLKENSTYGGKYAGETSSSYSGNRQSGWMPNADLMARFNLKNNQTFIVYVNGSYSHNDYNRSYRESEFKSLTDAGEDYYKGFASLLYTIGMKHNNSLAVQLNHLYQNSQSVYTGDYNDWQQLWSAESFFYTTYNQRIDNKLSLYAHAGFSVLQYKLLGKDRVDRIGPRLNGRLTIQPKSNQFLQIAFDITSTYPTLDRLNDVTQELEPFIVKRGNPGMDNSIFYQSNVGYSAQFGPVNIMAAASYFYSTNTVAEHYYADAGKLVSSYSSDAGFQFANTMVEVTWRATRFLRIKAKGQWLYSRISRLTDRRNQTWLGGVILDYYLKDWKFNIYANLPYRMVDTSLLRKEFEYETSYGASVGWNRGGLSAEIGVNNPFTKDGSIVTLLDTDAYRYRQTRHNESLQQTGYVKLSYTVDFGKKTDRDKNDTNKTINSAILKAY